MVFSSVAREFLYDFFGVNSQKLIYIENIFVDLNRSVEHAAQEITNTILGLAYEKRLLSPEGLLDERRKVYSLSKYVLIEGPSAGGKTSVTYSLEQQLNNQNVLAVTEPPSILIPGYLLEKYYVWGIRFVSDESEPMPCLGLPTWRHLCKGGLQVIPKGKKITPEAYMSDGIIGAAAPSVPGIPVALDEPVFQLLAFVWARLYFYSMYKQIFQNKIIISNRSFMSTVVFQAMNILVKYFANRENVLNKGGILELFKRVQKIIIHIHKNLMDMGLLPYPTDMVLIYPVFTRKEESLTDFYAYNSKMETLLHGWFNNMVEKYISKNTTVSVNNVDMFGEVDQYEELLGDKGGIKDDSQISHPKQFFFERLAYSVAAESVQEILGINSVNLKNPILEKYLDAEDDIYTSIVLPQVLLIMLNLGLGNAETKAEVATLIKKSWRMFGPKYANLLRKFNPEYQNIFDFLTP